jgi:hypothetical protein
VYFEKIERIHLSLNMPSINSVMPHFYKVSDLCHFGLLSRLSLGTKKAKLRSYFLISPGGLNFENTSRENIKTRHIPRFTWLPTDCRMFAWRGENIQNPILACFRVAAFRPAVQ